MIQFTVPKVFSVLARSTLQMLGVRMPGLLSPVGMMIESPHGTAVVVTWLPMATRSVIPGAVALREPSVKPVKRVQRSVTALYSSTSRLKPT